MKDLKTSQNRSSGGPSSLPAPHCLAGTCHQAGSHGGTEVTQPMMKPRCLRPKKGKCSPGASVVRMVQLATAREPRPECPRPHVDGCLLGENNGLRGRCVQEKWCCRQRILVYWENRCSCQSVMPCSEENILHFEHQVVLSARNE
ncbi:hypothetical protein E2C01_050611 [Portunus trituberculatus]|uniref:Uncharacterized protein n=1 Tax=Portunus trituberculatus TaxID=210409 RepID=A0A5B7GGG4_PORTR|nr:hypothetical protein [Portunus trituberculatus]